MRHLFILAALLFAPALASAQDWPGVAVPTGTCGGDLGGTFPNCTVDDDPSATTLLTQAATEDNLKYETSTNLYFVDVDQDGVKDVGEKYAVNDNIYYAADYASGSSTGGIQEAINAAEAAGGGVVQLFEGDYIMTGATPITISAASGEVTLQGHGTGASLIYCQEANSCTAPSIILATSNQFKIKNVHLIMRETTAGSTADGIWVGNTSTYPSLWRIEDVQVDGDFDPDDDAIATCADDCGNYFANGIYVRGLEGVIRNVRTRWLNRGVYLSGNSTGKANHIIMDNIDGGNMNSCFDTSVGANAANVGDSQSIEISNSICQSFYEAGLILRGGSSDTFNLNSAVLQDFYVESGDTGVKIIGSASAYDPIVTWRGGSAGSLTDGADADALSDAVTADSSVGSDIVMEQVLLSSTNCVANSGSGQTHLSALQNSSSPCIPTGRVSYHDNPVSWVTNAVATSTAITNTTTESAFDNCSYTIRANDASIGTVLRVTAGGVLSSDAAAPGNIALRLRYGTVNTSPLLIDLNQIGTLKLSATADGWTFSGTVTMRTLGASGTAVGNGFGVVPAVTGLSETIWDNQASTTTIDTTATATMTLFADWGTADTDNTITAETCVIERVQ